MARQKKLLVKEEGVIPIKGPMPENIARKETEEVKEEVKEEATQVLALWSPKTELGKKVKAGEIRDLSQILRRGLKIKEPEIVDFLAPNLETDFILLGQAKGKFGGGKRRVVKQTQKKTAEGNKPVFTCLAVVGNKAGIVGLGAGTAKETIPAREKAVRAAKLNISEVPLGCGSWRCACGEPHSLPFTITGRTGSVRVRLMPAPKGAGLVLEDEVKKLLRLAGYSDIWSKSFGQTRQKRNFAFAVWAALRAGLRMRAPKSGVRAKYGAT